MQKKYILVIVIVMLVGWVYWTSNKEINSTVIFLEKNNIFLHHYMMVPNNTRCNDPIFLLILVTSYVGHVELRRAHRHAMPNEYLKKFHAQRIFLTAKIPSHEKHFSQRDLHSENNLYGDILQGSFLENYRNLTFKHLMGLDWAAKRCPESKFILKIDDDTVFNLDKTYELLQKQNNIDRTNFLMGYILNDTRPKRSKENKWYVTREEYPLSYYPPYLSGWYYLTTPQVAGKLTYEAVFHSYFWIDDIFVTGVLATALNIRLKQLPEKYWLEYYELLECCLKDMIQKHIRCDYAVGPNGRRNDLIHEFNKEISNCNRHNNCRVRTDSEELRKVCIAFRERTIFSNGKPEVENIKL